jgi:hypothetical protein
MALDASDPAHQIARTIIADSFAETIRHIMLIAAGLALASAASGAFMIRNRHVSYGSPSVP